MKHNHLTLEDRVIIESELYKGSSRSSISKILLKDKSTICKEINSKKYVSLKYKFGKHTSSVRDCSLFAECGKNNFCHKPCSNYQMQKCKRRDKTVAVCNGCSIKSKCRKTKIIYSAVKAHDNYLAKLKDSRIGANLNFETALYNASIIKPLLDKGQSCYAIISNHSELMMCEKTLYNHIQNNVYKDFGVDVFSHRRKLKMKPRKSTVLKLRTTRKHLINRLFTDFEKYTAYNPHLNIVEMDTVYNDITNGPFMQTFYFRSLKILISFIHEKKTSQNMMDGVLKLKKLLKPALFDKYVGIILTDRGSEFYAAEEIETLGVKIFYCDPMASYQKAHLENIHGPLRFILPKACECKNLRALGLNTQEDLDLVVSHVNSYTLKELGGKSRFDYLKFIAGSDYGKILKRLNLVHLKPDDVCMHPKLLKTNKK